MITSRNIASSGHPEAPDVYFSQTYGRACEEETSGRWLSLSNTAGTWQMPVVLTPISGSPGRFDAASPYGYSGVHAAPGLTVEEQRRLWDASMLQLRAEGVVSLFLRHSALVPTIDLTAAGEYVEVVADHPTVAVDITSEEALWESLQGRTRTAVRKARKSGLEAQVRLASPQDCIDGSAFRSLYASTMDRVGASTRYRFTQGYYEALLDGLGENLLVTEVYDGEGNLGAAALLMRHGGLLHYHLSGSHPDQARLGANNLMIWGAMAWAAANDVSSFHLGGGVDRDDALLRFKRSFGGQELSYAATGHVVDTERYAELNAQIADEGAATAPYFPAYRRSSS